MPQSLAETPACSPRPDGSHVEAGFTMVEVLAALVILALTLAVLFDIVSTSLRRIGQAEKLTQATLTAQSLLARVGAEMALQEGQTAGRLGSDLRWRLQVRPFGDPTELQAWPITPYEISAEVLWHDGVKERSVILTTLRLGPKLALR